MLHPLSTFNHIVENWSYANAAARVGATGFLSVDIGKIAYQVDTGEYWRLIATTPTWSLMDRTIPSNAAITQATGFASDTYLVGSSIVRGVGDWKAKAVYQVIFDMTKTALGSAAFTVNIRMGTLGSVSDALILALAFAAGTTAADTGFFNLLVAFRSVGSGTSAVVQAVLECAHHLAATGLITTGASGTGILVATSAGFNSATPTTIGISVNGGASFAGTNTFVQAQLLNNNQ